MASRRAGNLPSDLSSFVGRTREMREVRQLLGQARLVSVVGPGGVGKSRFSIRLATQVQKNFRDGAWLVELAAVTDSSLVAETMAGALQVPEESNRDPVQALCEYLAVRDALLVVDNCEHLREACAVVLSTVLSRSPKLRVLLTSQEVLGLPGEAVYHLGPLEVPDGDVGTDAAEISPAVALFADRAANALHGFTLTKESLQAVVDLCRRVDGLPLAIELAAAHARTFTPAQMLDRMDNRFGLLAAKTTAIPARHQSFKATLNWSYELCGKPERLAWQRLSIFPSSFDLASAQAVCTDERLTTAQVEDAVGELVDRSLLMPRPDPWGMRYQLLESIRAFGRHMLREADNTEDALPESVLRSRHLLWYVAVATDFEREWFGSRQPEWLERLRADLPNIRAALSFAAEKETHRESGLILAGKLGFFWRVAALREGETWLTRLLGAGSKRSTGRACALVALARLLGARGDPAAATVAADALEAAQRCDPVLVPRALAIQGALVPDQANSIALLKRALAEAERIGSAADRAFILHRLGWSIGTASGPTAAEWYFRESVAMSLAAGELWSRGLTELRHAQIAWMYGQSEIMAASAAEALRASSRISDPLTCANALAVIAVAAVGRDDHLAARLFGVAGRVSEDAGGSILLTPPWQQLLDDAQARCRTMIGSNAFERHHQRGRAQSLDDAIANVLDERPPHESYEAEPDFALTRREFEVLELIAQGMTNKEIASRLVISVRTAEAHVQHILVKTGFATRTQLAAWHAARR
ncbi:ATP-binding protein [Nocardioides pocheonensis]|nr:LuxR C-terminal-related transcriptional regulator [Nocardioides pocheonensis]